MNEEHLLFVPDGFELGAVVSGRYRVTKFLGTGGSGFVVLAEDLHLDNSFVVLKFLHTHLIEDQFDIQTIQNLIGYQDVSTTMIYTHVLNRGGHGVDSPADRL